MITDYLLGSMAARGEARGEAATMAPPHGTPTRPISTGPAVLRSPLLGARRGDSRHHGGSYPLVAILRRSLVLHQIFLKTTTQNKQTKKTLNEFP